MERDRMPTKIENIQNSLLQRFVKDDVEFIFRVMKEFGLI